MKIYLLNKIGTSIATNMLHKSIILFVIVNICNCNIYLNLIPMLDPLAVRFLDFFPSVRTLDPKGYSLCVPGESWITHLQFTGSLIRPTPKSSSSVSSSSSNVHSSWFEDNKAAYFITEEEEEGQYTPIHGTMYKLKNGTWYYRDYALALRKGDILLINFTVTLINNSVYPILTKEFKIPIGPISGISGQSEKSSSSKNKKSIFSFNSGKDKFKNFIDHFDRNLAKSFSSDLKETT